MIAISRRALLAVPLLCVALTAMCAPVWAQSGDVPQAGGGPATAASQESEPPGAGGQTSPPPDDSRIELEADTVRLEAGATLAEGHVRVRTRGLTVAADSGVMDQVRVHLVGSVVVSGDGVSSTATSLDVNLDTEKWRLGNGRATIEPGFFDGAVEEPLYLTGVRIETPEGRDTIEAFAAIGTSCNKPHPHYALESNHIRVVPNRKVTFRRPSLYVFGSRLVRYPFDVTLALDRRDNRFVPEVGQNEVEGYYAKFGYLYTLGDQNSGLLRLHFTQLRGTGFGFDHELDAARQSGQLSLFFEPSDGAIASRLQHRYEIARGTTSDLTADYQRNSGYYGDSQSLSSGLTLRRSVGGSSSQLGFQEAISQSGSSDSRRFSTSLTHQERLGTTGTWDLRTTMRDSAYRSDQPSDQELDGTFEYRNRQRRYDWQLLADNRWDLDGSRYTGDSSYRALNRLPELVLNTDTERMSAPALLERVNTRAQIALGRFSQDPDKLDVSRAAFKLDLGGRETRLSSNTRLRSGARYYQSFYDEGSAQYVLGATADLQTDWDSHWATRLTTGYSNPAGFAPIRIDYWGKQSDVGFQVVRMSRDRSRLDLSSGYDFVNDRWRTVLGEWEVMTSGSSKLELQTGFDIEGAQWRPLEVKWAFAHPRQLYVGIGGQYDLDDSQVRQVSLDLDWTVADKWRLEYQTRFSGYTQSLDQMDVRITRDLHCWIGSVSYSKLTGEFQVNLGLKAFPSLQTNFGMQRGASFQAGGGGYY